MKTGLLILLSFFFTLTLPAQLSASKRVNSYDELKKEIRSELKNLDFSFLGDSVEDVTLEFLINAQNEIVVLDVFGRHPRTCNAIKEWLSYRRLKYQEALQLTRYIVHLKVKGTES